jgi:hypothetical protein
MGREWSGAGDHKTQMRQEIITPVIKSSRQSERLLDTRHDLEQEIIIENRRYALLV